MAYDYQWHRDEANFGPVVPSEIPGGTHFTIESVPIYRGSYVAFRRPQAIPHHEIPERASKFSRGALYFIHDLPLWGETLTAYIDRIVQEQTGVGAMRIRVIDLTMKLYEDSRQWALTPYLLVELDALPVPGIYGNEVTQVVTFTKDTIPNDFGWYDYQEVTGLINSIEAVGK